LSTNTLLFGVIHVFLKVAAILFFQDVFFMSPASTTFDALGLVKQINERNAPALEETHELLASGTLQNQCSEEDSDKENIDHIIIKKEHVTTNQPSKVMVRKLHWCLIMNTITDDYN
jgi:hypothetical protein